MKLFKGLLILMTTLSLTSFKTNEVLVVVQNLRIEMLSNPTGIDVLQPRLSWETVSLQRGTEQIAFQILVASTAEKLWTNEGDLWNSGKVNSSASQYVKYTGKPLNKGEKAFWKVKVWTNKGESDWSQNASWTLGLHQYKDWEGRWIGFDRYFPWDNADQPRLSARYFRKEFATTKPVKSATASIIGLGLYELYIDGKKIGDQVLAPAPTDYTQNIKYNTFDVTQQLKEGKHAIGVILGNGRFFEMRQTKAYKQKTFGFPKLLMQVNIVYADGSKLTVKTDESWKGTANGPILANNEYDGEDYDARKEMPGWNQSGFNEQAWLKPEYVQEPGGTYEAQMNQFMKVMQDVAPVSITKRPNGNHIIDFGQNMSGWVKFRVKGEKGRKLTLKFAESLQPNGELFIANLRDAKTTDTYILKGQGIEEWEPRFVYHGFRYVEVSGYPGTPSKNDFTARFVYDDMQTVGSFESSNPLLNQIHQNSWWGIASNYKGMPVDCPQRNERQPWLGDRPTQAYGESFLFDNTALYNKWLQDIRYAQKPDGAIPDVAPAFWRYYSDNMTWPGTLLMISDMLYRQTGDISVLHTNYPAMKKWLLYMHSRYLNDEGILTKDSYGDWCAPPESIEAGRGVNADQKHPSMLIATAYYYHYLNMMSRFAKLTGNDADIASFEALASVAKTAFNKKFYNEKGYYGENKLTDNLLAVHFGLVEDQNKDKVHREIANIIEVKNKGHLSTGLVGTQWLMRTLSDIGRADLAYTIVSKKTYPSWGYMIENGATAIWELWNGNTANPKMNSQNHVMMLGDLMVWYYENLLGIKSDYSNPGFKQIIMKPEMIEGLNYAKGSYKSPYGLISSDWKKDGKAFAWKITVPANTKALVYVPANSADAVSESGKKAGSAAGVKFIKMESNRAVYELGSGVYSFNSSI
ncbi:family 78 glycoside hydrolase catalytic domain [Paradesertivirga mongoliensis]|uniref:alpha-L-rhamnosidase n=1 Tax=Paradesertivirga mongoliensis TaxID=2100740 RepID=A0ABW4ZPC2_9SPHI|nr:alpha-L-rhamnosidase [Pedobacter mongoliensis]